MYLLFTAQCAALLPPLRQKRHQQDPRKSQLSGRRNKIEKNTQTV